jgi:hypothetical protein
MLNGERISWPVHESHTPDFIVAAHADFSRLTLDARHAQSQHQQVRKTRTIPGIRHRNKEREKDRSREDADRIEAE